MRRLIKMLLCPLLYASIEGSSGHVTYFTPQQFYSWKDTLRGELFPIPIESKSSSARLYYNEYGLLACTSMDNSFFQLLDSTNASIIQSAGRGGRGPEEFLSVMSMQYDYLRLEKKFSRKIRALKQKWHLRVWSRYINRKVFSLTDCQKQFFFLPLQIHYITTVYYYGNKN